MSSQWTADPIVMHGVTEYAEDMPVWLVAHESGPRVRAFNEAGHNMTEIDLTQLITWLRANRPDVLATPTATGQGGEG